MPEAAARLAIALGLPPLDLLAYQIHMPSPSNGEPGGVAAGSGALIGAGTIGGGSCLALAAAGRIDAAATAAGSAKRRTLRFLAPLTRATSNTVGVPNGAVRPTLGLNGGANLAAPPFS